MALFGDIPLPAARDILDQYSRIMEAEKSEIQNQYMPDKMRIDNALKQNELNFAPQMSKAGLAYQKELAPHMRAQTGLVGAQTSHLGMEDQFMPLKYAIDAQNSNRSNQRFGQAYQLKQWLSTLPKAESDRWITDHPDEYAQMGVDIANGVSGGQSKNQTILTPEFLQKFFKPGTSEVPSAQNMPPALPMTDAQKQAVGNRTQGMPLTANPNMSSIFPNQAGGGLAQSQTPQIPMMAAQNGQPNAPSAQNTLPVPAGAPAPGQPNIFHQQTPEERERSQNTLKLSANKRAVGPKLNNRAEAAVAMENWLTENHDEYAPRILNASKYAGALGKGQKFVDQLMQQSPQAYLDYKWTKNAFRGSLANLIKQMEGLNGDVNQRQELHDLAGNIDDLDVNPEGAVKNFNRTISTLQDLSKSVLKAAEPVYPGNYQKIHKFKEFKNNYLDVNPANGSSGNMVVIQTPDGRTASIPKDNLDKALKLGAKQVN